MHLLMVVLAKVQLFLYCLNMQKILGCHFWRRSFPKFSQNFIMQMSINHLETMDTCDSIFDTINVTKKQAQNIETDTLGGMPYQ